jgi:hypothetical protein
LPLFFLGTPTGSCTLSQYFRIQVTRVFLGLRLWLNLHLGCGCHFLNNRLLYNGLRIWRGLFNNWRDRFRGRRHFGVGKRV